MGWVDPRYIPALREDGRYTRLLNLTERLLAEREAAVVVPTCGSCQNGQVAVTDTETGQTYTIPCERCDGTGTVPEYADNEDNGRAGDQ